ncbi:hypothetical protein [Corynebacterium mastitidis]|uniref:hypothetical protein n=1 Tax=Corynebacterium mastitidis TaxID=161890 RepID=UPI00254C364C|nr:hypothetical protein [Corynebacterium mastitidis]MDK8450341.1 hypothetical protein [Corynebacterium mastitidis]
MSADSSDSSAPVPGAIKAAYGLSVAGAVLALLSALVALTDAPQAEGAIVRVNLWAVGATNAASGLVVAALAPRLRRAGSRGIRARRGLAAACAASVVVSVLGLIVQAVGVAVLLHVIAFALGLLAMFRPAATTFLRGSSRWGAGE